MIGFFAMLALGVVRLRRGGASWARARELARAALPKLLRVEVLLGFVVLACVIIFIDRSPIVAWDARSIWFFRAKQLFTAGRFLPIDAKTYPWTHPGYPLLYPALAAFFSALRRWDEHMSAISVLLASLMSLVFMLSRRALGRWSGLAFAIIPARISSRRATGGYAAASSPCLLVAVLGFVDDDTEPVGMEWARSRRDDQTRGVRLRIRPVRLLLADRRSVARAAMVPARPSRSWAS